MIAKLLVANRGEIARRIMRTCRASGIATVAVFSEPDRGAPFVLEAEESVPLGGASPAESYLRGDAILCAAAVAGADAIHPGYGFLAENAEFAEACSEAAITFIGPSPHAIRMMGSKIEAKRRMKQAGVPILPGATVTGLDGRELLEAAEEVGYPLLVKASAGGGGKGMRVVRDADELINAVGGARREATSAFGDDAMFLERYLQDARHVEIQILGDQHGTLVHLFERECSIQRRHQKILEESPSPFVDDALRARMGEAAVAAGAALGYYSAGTVEFLVTPGGEFFFLEMNTRLQVEHPVTELVCGIDLVAQQLAIAEGAALGPGVTGAELDGHAIEVRLYAEDPEQGFLPVSGTLHHFGIREGAGVRVDAGIIDGSEVSIHYDPMIAKVIAHAPTRVEAARRLASALESAELDGVRTNRALLVRILRHPEFLAGAADIRFLERHDPAQLGAPLLDRDEERLHAVAAALARQAERREQAAVLGALPSGWRNNAAQDQSAMFEGAGGTIEVRYRFQDGRLATLAADDHVFDAPRLHACTSSLVDLEVDGLRRGFRVRRHCDLVAVSGPRSQADLRELPRFADPEEDVVAGSLLSPMPGAVVLVNAAMGERIERGAVLMVIEAMKMHHELLAPASGTVTELRVTAGDQVQAGALLAAIEEEVEHE